MTLLGIPTWHVHAVAGPKYTVGPVCANPGCSNWAEHAHHIVRRSHLGGRDERDWIEVEGEVVANVCGLCPPCHDQVTGREGTGHQAAIFLRDGVWWWCEVDDQGELATLRGTRVQPVAPLDPHPSTLEGAERRSPSSEAAIGSEVCPTCGQAARRRAGPRGPARRRKTWVVNVPDDSEDGAEVLDTLVDDLALVLGYEPGASARYYVLVPALVSAQINRSRFLDEIKGVGE